MLAQDELTAAVSDAVKQLTQVKKAEVLLNTALTLIEDGQCWEEVANYLDVYLKTPGLPEEGLAKASLARGSLQTSSREPLFTAQQAYQLVPPEVWERIAIHMPRYHLRTWLFVSRFHRDIASRCIFRTIDIYFGEHDNPIRGIEIFQRAQNDPEFACRVQTLRLHWEFDELVERNLVDLLTHIFTTSLPAFKALQDFEWIGCPDMKESMVQDLLYTHKHLHGLGVIGLQCSDISSFSMLRKLTIRTNFMKEIRTILDRNESTLKHLILGNFLNEPWWDSAFESVTIDNLAKLDLVDTCVSHFVLTRIASAHNLQSLTLHRAFLDLDSASALFASDRIIDGSHSLLPHLEAFRLLLDEHVEPSFYQSVTHFLRKREKLRRLDLGGCPWDLLHEILPDLRGLRALAVYIDHLSDETIKSVVESIPSQMVAIGLSVGDSDGPLHQYARYLTRFKTLSFLHLQSRNYLPKSDENFRAQRDKDIGITAVTLPSLDFIALNFEPFVGVKSHGVVSLRPLGSRQCLDSASVDFGDEDAAWLERKDAPIIYEIPG